MSSIAPTEELLHSILVEFNINVVCLALWMYEYILTFVSEVNFIWKSPWTIPKVLFLMSRYWPSVTLIILFYRDFQLNLSDEGCIVCHKCIIWSVNVSMCIAETILTIRTWAVWGGGRNISIFLCALILVTGVPNLVIMGMWGSALQLVSVPSEVVPSRCWPSTESSLYFANYLLVAVYEGVLLIMMSIKGYEALKDGPIDSGLFHAVYTNGVVYYVYMFVLSVTNIMINMHAPHSYGNLLALFQQVVHSALACRMLLQLRECGKQTVRGDGFKGYGSAFTPNVSTFVFKAAAAIEDDAAGADGTDDTQIGSTMPFHREYV